MTRINNNHPEIKQFVQVLSRLTKENQLSASVFNLALGVLLRRPKVELKANGKTYILVDSNFLKMVIGEDYNFIFNKTDGQFHRWGRDYEEDPVFSPIGGEILDIEVTTICRGINGRLCPFCSPKGTKINTPHGTKNIEKIKVGDLVLGFDIKNDHITIQKVEETYRRHYVGELICIETENGEILKLTPEHIVILKGGTEKQAKNIDENDEIISF